jgi:hypothetical protein
MIQVSSLRDGLAVAKGLKVQKLPLKINAARSVQRLRGCFCKEFQSFSIRFKAMFCLVIF